MQVIVRVWINFFTFVLKDRESELVQLDNLQLEFAKKAAVRDITLLPA